MPARSGRQCGMLRSIMMRSKPRSSVQAGQGNAARASVSRRAAVFLEQTGEDVAGPVHCRRQPGELYV